jgi:Trypsin-like peptidase domain
MSRATTPSYLLLIALMAVLAAGCASAASAGDPISSVPVASADEASSLQQRFVSIVRTVSPEVVQVRTPLALGSGVVFDARGDVVTNAHVVDNATRFTVTLTSGDSHPAILVGRDVATDLAVIRIRGARPRPATFANSAEVEVGDLTLAIGNPARAALECDRGHRLGGRAQRAGNRQRDSFLGHSDQRGDQSRELGRRARRPLRSGDRNSYPRRGRSRNGRRGTRHRFRDRQQHGAPDRSSPG